MTQYMGTSAGIGKIVRSESHVRYTCQIYAPGEVARPPEPIDYAFGSFVHIPLRSESGQPAITEVSGAVWEGLTGADVAGPQSVATVSPRETVAAIGLIYDTILVNPAYGTLGPRLSNDTQVELFSPDYLSERAVLVSILLLGTMASSGGTVRVMHGVPPLAPDLGAEVSALPEEDVRRFHSFADLGVPGGARPYLHMGYLPHAVAQDNALLPIAMLRTIERLEQLFPENVALLSIVKRNFSWRLKVQTAG